MTRQPVDLQAAAIRIVRESTAAQDLPEQISDPTAVDRLAGLIARPSSSGQGASSRRQTLASRPPLEVQGPPGGGHPIGPALRPARGAALVGPGGPAGAVRTDRGRD